MLNVVCVHVSPHRVPPPVSHSPNPLSVCIEQRRPLWDAEEGGVVAGVVVIEVRGVEEVEALQGALHRQTEAGRPTAVTREPTLREVREEEGEGDLLPVFLSPA